MSGVENKFLIIRPDGTRFIATVLVVHELEIPPACRNPHCLVQRPLTMERSCTGAPDVCTLEFAPDGPAVTMQKLIARRV